MNNFEVDITGYIGKVKPRSFYLPPNASVEYQSFKIESGPGCDPTKGTKRTIKGRWLIDNAPDTINSYDFEYVLDMVGGKKVYPTAEAVSDVQPVQLESEIQATKTRAPRGRAAWKEKP